VFLDVYLLSVIYSIVKATPQLTTSDHEIPLNKMDIEKEGIVRKGGHF